MHISSEDFSILHSDGLNGLTYLLFLPNFPFLILYLAPDMQGWTVADRCFTYDDETFTKRDLLESERPTGWQGHPVKTPWSSVRLQNEHAALAFIRDNTTIPVPKILEFKSISSEGTYQLKMERVYGTPLSKIRAGKEQATKAVDEYITQFVLPQLHSLRSRNVGALTGDIIPPMRLWGQPGSRQWTPWKSWSKTNVFVHNDLGQQNILVDDNFNVVGIVDWECSGFYPDYFEAPLWTKSLDDEGYFDIDAHNIPRLVEFLSQRERRPLWLRDSILSSFL
ncbi:hypothetical protein ABEF92_007061 [Exophiala dermatitidis]|uniref:Aminoglycoside phosphotransferase domain-containing protein n=2 Tax=Exophiala dermatitidis TaxID=5970 RepID=H6C9F7_EXODN|nr:uncharacterized protein HMPREF1120_08675 [Exophiala dermatitidis NIH/UT8656]EHY60727.1 hypothetical protein HMPREF1120_08675 [Exophiala dermatitidis NIH/UT8656]